MIRKWLAMALAALCTHVAAQGYPDRPVTLVQGFAAGGNADTIARIVAQGLARELGQPVVVEPKTGAGGNVASAAVARAKPDGYTLILLTGGHAVSAAMYKSLAFDPVEDFEWLSMVTRFPFVLATAQGSPHKSVADVLRAAKAAPGTLTFSSVGIGSTQHLSGELLQSLSRTQLVHVPYRGGAAPVQDVIGGRVDLMFDTVTVARSQIEGGKLRALGVTSTDPWPFLPGVEPIGKTVPGFEVSSWTAIAAPKGTPPAIAGRLHEALGKVLKDPAIGKQLEATGGIASPSGSGAEMKAFVGSQVNKWKALVLSAQIPQQ
jgi:tripartite-type tricarboxylate transporter receptor subunit TctC